MFSRFFIVQGKKLLVKVGQQHLCMTSYAVIKSSSKYFNGVFFCPLKLDDYIVAFRYEIKWDEHTAVITFTFQQSH